MIKVYQIPFEQFDQYWPHIEGYMERAAKYTYGKFKAEDIKELFSLELYRDKQLNKIL